MNDVLLYALSSNASDLFISAGRKPAFRRRGVIAAEHFEAFSAEAVNTFRKSAAGASGEEIYAKTGSFDASYTVPGGFRFRINFYDTLTGPAFAVRPILSGGDLFTEKLNLPDVIDRLAEEPRGLILVSGSTGSGKSTTLGAMINHINRKFNKHILTIEDPIEFIHSDISSFISQREINTDTVSFSDALRSALRENPDVIVVGEMRDTETIRTALNAALTGHLVISTVHTADTVQAVERIINMFPEGERTQAAVDLGMALCGIVSQRLIPASGGEGMLPAMEILLGTSPVKKLISDRDYRALEDALKRGAESGMTTFNRAIFKLYKTGAVTLADAMESAGNKSEFDLLVKGMESGVDAFRSHYGGDFDMDGANFVDMRSLLRSAIKSGASDLILTNGASPTLRMNGALRALDLPPLASTDIQRLLFSIITQRQRVELEEKRELDFALAVTMSLESGASDSAYRFRINGFYQRGTLGVVARIVNSRIPTPQELTLPEQVVALTDKQQGLIIITGPTGSGKSTTLASLIDRINRKRTDHIITVEDPIEYVHTNINSIVEQRELHSDTFTFATALKYALRQDPDVIMVGEMRDVETMAAAITAAETGHLVLATIHTNSAPQTIDRIVDSFPTMHQNQIRLQLAGVLLGVVSQRLLPTLDGKGRVAAFEVMIGTPPVLALIRDGRTHQLQSVIETSAKDGMGTLEKSMEALYARGLVSLEEIKSYKADYKTIKSF